MPIQPGAAQDEAVLVGTSKRELRISRANPRDDCWKFVPHAVHLSWELIGLKKADDHCTPYAAGAQDRGEAVPANFRIVQPKFIQRIPL